MTAFSPQTRAALTSAGWHPGRCVNTLDYQRAVAADGYRWFPAVEQFLHEFGGLHISCMRRTGQDTLHFDAREATEGVDPDWVLEDYAPRIGTSALCVIGQAHSYHVLLFMDDTGTVYGGFDQYLCRIASSGQAAIDVICQSHPVQEIPALAE